ncbi:hypothetical protein N3K63_04775 [Microbacterium sp. W1N]|uniref:hypothetical protein n=1 Tax=Microbacterium festucae TaxID=2977531 RepID=UPI0021C13684|nr:hypothetical protein [Microbacterium festucae]MCT9819597.1 hypothetical protein [Microbacterium festucae]
MQDLVGRLTALDPAASDSLKVISYFDALVAGGAGVEALVRAAAVLGGCAAGVSTPRRRIRVDADGRRTGVADPAGADPAGADPGWPTLAAPERTVWLERDGAAHANDAMILDRLALAVDIVDRRREQPEAALEVLLDPTRDDAQRAAAAARLQLSPGDPVRVVAAPAEAPAPPQGRTALVATPRGPVRAVLGAAHTAPAAGPAGHALAADPMRLAAAWADALIALRLTDARHPIVDADALGALMLLVRAHDPARGDHPDVVRLRALDAHTLALLDALAEAESVRAAASALSLHHSSVQSRHESLTRALGYDPRSATGRLRYGAARLLARLAD